jgi:hypothetical protein
MTLVLLLIEFDVNTVFLLEKPFLDTKLQNVFVLRLVTRVVQYLANNMSFKNSCYQSSYVSFLMVIYPNASKYHSRIFKYLF